MNMEYSSSLIYSFIWFPIEKIRTEKTQWPPSSLHMSPARLAGFQKVVPGTLCSHYPLASCASPLHPVPCALSMLSQKKGSLCYSASAWDTLEQTLGMGDLYPLYPFILSSCTCSASILRPRVHSEFVIQIR